MTISLNMNIYTKFVSLVAGLVTGGKAVGCLRSRRKAQVKWGVPLGTLGTLTVKLSSLTGNLFRKIRLRSGLGNGWWLAEEDNEQKPWVAH